MGVRIPVKLNDSKLVSVSFELRFESSEAYSDLIALNLANSLVKLGIGPIFQLPVMQLPPIARANDPALRYSPLLGVKQENLVVQVGPRVLVVTTEDYPGWAAFSSAIQKFLDCTKDYRIRTERIGFRTINFFADMDIENSLKTKVETAVELEKSSCNFSIVYNQDDCRARISFSNDAKMSRNNQQGQKGSFLDIDSFFEGNPDEMIEKINSLHSLGKKVFFESLTDDFVQSMRPEY